MEQIMLDRIKRIDMYHNRHGNQQKWYSQRASSSKKLFERIGLVIIVLAAITGLVPLLELDGSNSISLSEKVTSVLAALIVILKGMERIWLPEEKWQNYRKASEALKRETKHYAEGVLAYGMNIEEDKLFKLYVERCSFIEAEEQNNFWGLECAGKLELDKRVEDKRVEDKRDEEKE